MRTDVCTHTDTHRRVQTQWTPCRYVGQSEENIRALFADAEAEMKVRMQDTLTTACMPARVCAQERGDDSDLHIIIFDEIDAICKYTRTTTCTHAHAHARMHMHTHSCLYACTLS